MEKRGLNESSMQCHTPQLQCQKKWLNVFGSIGADRMRRGMIFSCARNLATSLSSRRSPKIEDMFTIGPAPFLSTCSISDFTQ